MSILLEQIYKIALQVHVLQKCKHYLKAGIFCDKHDHPQVTVGVGPFLVRLLGKSQRAENRRANHQIGVIQAFANP